MTRGSFGAVASLQQEREERLARIIDREVAPSFHDRFAGLIYREMPSRQGTFAIDVACGLGRTTSELLQRLDDDSRVLALEPDSASIEMAKGRVQSHWKDRVYFQQSELSATTELPDATADLVVVEPPHRGDRDRTLDDLPQLHTLVRRSYGIEPLKRAGFLVRLNALLAEFGV